MPDPTFQRLTKSGQPVMNSTIEIDTIDGYRFTIRVVGKLYGRGGNADLIGIIVEDVDDPRYRIDARMAARETQR